MQRIIILGPSGSGKSTLAKKLEKVLGLPLIHLDKIYWQPGWVESDREDFAARLAGLLEDPAWIVDGNYTSHLPARFNAADTIIHLDYPRRIHMARVLKRIATSYGRVRFDMAPGCPEQLDLEFLIFCWTFQKVQRPKLLAQIERVQDSKNILSFSHPDETESWLQSLKGSPDGATP